MLLFKCFKQGFCQQKFHRDGTETFFNLRLVSSSDVLSSASFRLLMTSGDSEKRNTTNSEPLSEGHDLCIALEISQGFVYG